MEILLPKVYLFPVKSAKDKLLVLTMIAKEHFEKKEPLLFLTSDVASAKFLDDLLWKSPEESFLPHKILEEPADELLAITTRKENLNQAKYFFNLCPEPLVSFSVSSQNSTSPSASSLPASSFELSSPPSLSSSFETSFETSLPCRYIYEFDDQSLQKKDLAKSKFSLYREKAYPIELRELSF